MHRPQNFAASAGLGLQRRSMGTVVSSAFALPLVPTSAAEKPHDSTEPPSDKPVAASQSGGTINRKYWMRFERGQPTRGSPNPFGEWRVGNRTGADRHRRVAEVAKGILYPTRHGSWRGCGRFPNHGDSARDGQSPWISSRHEPSARTSPFSETWCSAGFSVYWTNRPRF